MEQDLNEKVQEQELKCENVLVRPIFLSKKGHRQEVVDSIEDCEIDEKIYLTILHQMRMQRARRVQRFIENDPAYCCFKPAGVPKSQLEHIEILVGEYEAMRLRDLEGLSMQAGAEQMGVSAPTFNRMVNSAHQKVTEALVYGKGIRIYGKNNQKEL